MTEEFCFVAVEFVDDDNVRGYTYWYICDFKDVEVDDKVIAPLGRHNRVQAGVVRRVLIADEFEAPYPMYGIKRVQKLIKSGKIL